MLRLSFFVRLLLAVSLGAAAQQAFAQYTYVPPPTDITIEKKSVFELTGPNQIEERSNKITINVRVTDSTAAQLRMRSPAGEFEVAGIGGGWFKLERTFNTRAAMDQSFPDGTYTFDHPKVLPALLPSGLGALINSRITNWDALQSWNGRDSVVATVSTPTPPFGFTTEASLSVLLDFYSLAQGQTTMSSPSTTIIGTLDRDHFGWADPGRVLNAAVGFVAQRTIAGTPEKGGTRVTSSVVISFPVTRTQNPPAIQTQPVAQRVLAGASVSFSVAASSGGLKYQWRKDGSPILGATAATYTIASAQSSHAGLYDVIVTNTGGTVISDEVRLTVETPQVPPTITTPPVAASLSAGARHTLSVVAAGTPALSYQWFRDGTAIAGATASQLVFEAARPSDAGAYTVAVTNAHGTVTSTAAVLSVAAVNRISNLSIRTRVGGDAGMLTVGLTVGGSGAATKPLLVRAVGPTLGVFGVEGVLPDPQLTLLSGANVVAQNDDWSGNGQVTQVGTSVGAFGLVSEQSKDAAFVPSAAPGSYTIRVTGAGSTSGVALAEVYDASSSDTFVAATPRLINVSALTRAGTGAEVFITGFSITGSGPVSVLIRGVGPTLESFGVAGALANPKLEVFMGGAAQPMAVNDDWSAVVDPAAVRDAAATVGAFVLPAASRDAALLLRLSPGSYTVQISGVDGATGVALVEVYEVPAADSGR